MSKSKKKFGRVNSNPILIPKSNTTSKKKEQIDLNFKYLNTLDTWIDFKPKLNSIISTIYDTNPLIEKIVKFEGETYLFQFYNMKMIKVS